MKKIGPKMHQAVIYVANHPGCRILPVAEEVGPHGSRQYGYAIVHRAIKAGLIKAVKDKHGRYTLTPIKNED